MQPMISTAARAAPFEKALRVRIRIRLAFGIGPRADFVFSAAFALSRKLKQAFDQACLLLLHLLSSRWPSATRLTQRRCRRALIRYRAHSIHVSTSLQFFRHLSRSLECTKALVRFRRSGDAESASDFCRISLSGEDTPEKDGMKVKFVQSSMKEPNPFLTTTELGPDVLRCLDWIQASSTEKVCFESACVRFPVHLP